MIKNQKTERHTPRSTRGKIAARQRDSIQIILEFELQEGEQLTRMAQARGLTLNELVLGMLRDFFSDPAPLHARARALELT